MNAAGGVNGNITYDSNNLSGYLSYKELYDYINDRTER